MIKVIANLLGIMGPLRRVKAVNKNFRHIRKEFFYRLPNPFYRKIFSLNNQLSIKAVAELEQFGIVRVDNLICDQSVMRDLSQKFNEMVRFIETSPQGPQKLSPEGYLPSTIYIEHGVDQAAKTVHAHNPFKFVPELLHTCLHPTILGICELYLKRNFYLNQSIASRYYPKEPSDFGSFQWHHDAWGRKINVMYLLTDVSEDDQYMTFIRGSHKKYYNFDRCGNSRFTDQEITKLFPNLDHFKCIGKAGTIFVFDSNGMHRGNRSLGEHRDTVITSFNAGRYVWNFEAPAEFRTQLTKNQRKFLQNSSKLFWK